MTAGQPNYTLKVPVCDAVAIEGGHIQRPTANNEIIGQKHSEERYEHGADEE